MLRIITEHIEADGQRTQQSIGQKDAGRIVCACFSVGVNTVIGAIQAGNLTSAEQIGAAPKAGTNCGFCVPELKALPANQQCSVK